MFKKINNLRIKHKFLIMCISFLTIGVVADIGLYEFSKITDFQRLEREYLAYLDVFVLHFKELEYIKKPEKNSKHVYRVLDRKSDLRERMGLIQTLEGMRQVAQSILETANPIEKFFLSVSGFGEAFHIADDNYDDIIVMQHTIEDYRNNDITYDNFIRRVNSFVGRIRQYDDAFARIANETSHFVSAAMISIGTIFLIVIAIISIFLYREAMKPLNEAKESIYTSSQELQTNSKQQLQSASSQTTAMNEISSVMQELVATSRQVSESSSRANTLAQDTNNAVRESHKLLDKALEGTFEIKEKMEIISSNMLSLGEKAQQIGIVLDVINELSQQVTVLSYNATIEAAGAGEMGKRFMAVADRIIKLAERSVESSKEIKAIIDDVQNDSHKTIMSTEDGMKAVERGIVYSSEVKQSLESIDEFTKHVLSSVDEINISLNQQKTGVEQAAAEVEDITMLVCETEDSSKQVMKTAEQLFDMAELLEKI